jgi:anti-sigma-K factor RskA
MDRPVDPVDLLLGELDDAGRAEAERLMRDDPAFRAEVERLRPLVARLEALPDEAWDPPVPPPLRMPADARPVAERGPSLGERVGAWFARRPSVPMPALALGAVAVLAAGAGIGALVAGGGGDAGTPAAPGGPDVVLAAYGAADPAAAGDARMSEVDGTQEMTLDVHGLAPSGGRDLYTVWLLGEDGRMISLGSFRVPASGAAQVQVPVPVSAAAYDFVDVSVEPDDGDPRHSGDSVLRGRVA